MSLFGSKIRIGFHLLAQLSILVQDANDDNWTQKSAWEKDELEVGRGGRVARPTLYKHHYIALNDHYIHLSC